MSEKKIVVPEEMLKASLAGLLKANYDINGTKVLTWGQKDSIQPVLQASLHWLDAELLKIKENGVEGDKWTDGYDAAIEDVRKMYLMPEAEVQISQETRQEAIDYWKSLHPNSPLIPIGEINGILEIEVRGR